MRAGIVVTVTPADGRRLEAIVRDRSTPQKHVWRAKIILATADGCGTAEIMRRSGKSKPVVWRWQARFMAEGIAGLTRDKTRKPGKPPLSAATVQRVVDLALGPPPSETTHWTGRMLAEAAGVSLRSVQRILEAHQLAPHRIRTFKLSNDPKFPQKLKDIVGLYVDPPAHAVVLSVDEKSQIQALDRTQPGLPMKPGRAGTMTHDYKRHGTTTLFAALNILDGTVIGCNMKRHRHQEFIRFLNTVEAKVPKRKAIHAIVDNYATHKHPKVSEWLARHPRWTFHFTPTSASWLNAVEGFFAKLTRRRLQRGIFHSVADLKDAINRFLAETNSDPKPFVWTADPKRVIAAVKRGKQTLESVHWQPQPPSCIRQQGRRRNSFPSSGEP
jgi:transposase